MRSDLVGALGSVRASLFLGGATAAMLVLASFFVPNPRSREALPFNESIRVFFDPVSLDHAWFYALLVVVAAYGVNAVFGTWVHASRRLAAGSVDRRFVGIVLMHVGFVLGLLAHLVAGFGTAVEEQAVIGPTPTTVAGRAARLVEVHEVHHPDGSLRTLQGEVELDGERLTLGFNDPIFLDGLRRWILVTGAAEAPGAPRFSRGGAPVDLAASGWSVVRASEHRSLKAPMLLVRRDADGQTEWLGAGLSTSDGLRFEGVETAVALGVVVRRNEGLPWVAVASVVFSAGLFFFAWAARERSAA